MIGIDESCNLIRLYRRLTVTRSRGGCEQLRPQRGELVPIHLKRIDIEVWNPFTGAGQTVIRGETVRCIGLIEDFKYQGGDTDPIRISCYISKGNQSNIRAKLAKPLTNTKVKMAWYIISYDESAKQWYEAVKLVSPKIAQTNVNSAEGEMQIFMEKDPEKLSETLDINVYRFEFELIPQEKKKVRVQYATGPTKRVVRQWGE